MSTRPKLKTKNFRLEALSPRVDLSNQIDQRQFNEHHPPKQPQATDFRLKMPLGRVELAQDEWRWVLRSLSSSSKLSF
jgi:hypothetical protein